MFRGKRINKPVIMMTHGIVDSSDSFIINVPEKAPAFVAAAAGYDVWVANLRGNNYSRKHVSLDPDHDLAYWQHSWSEIGKYDIPAFLREIT